MVLLVVTYSSISLDQSFTPEHGFSNLSHDICSITGSKQHDTPTSPAHTSCSAKTMNKVNGSVWDIVEDDVADGDGIDTS